MIISDKYQFVFVHIPKCGGTYIRKSIQKFDDTQGFFESRIDYVGNLEKKINYTHIPLTILEKYFPCEYLKLVNYQSFATIRNPYDRFFSAFSQYIRDTYTDISNLSKKILVNKFEQTLEKVEKIFSYFPVPNPEYLYFMPQTYYIKNNNMIIIKKLFTIEQISNLYSYISDLVHEEISRPKTKINVSRMYRNDFFRILFSTSKNVAKSILPKQTYFMLREYVDCKYSKLIFESDYKYLFDSSEVREFITRYYKDDIEIYNSILASELT